MRIIDWSSEVCSSDLPPPKTIFKKIPSTWKRQDWKGTTKFFRQDQACVYEANGRWHGYLMQDSGVADTITDDREEDEVGDGKGFGERELSFATAEEMSDWIEPSYPLQKAVPNRAAGRQSGKHIQQTA